MKGNELPLNCNESFRGKSFNSPRRILKSIARLLESWATISKNSIVFLNK